MQLVLKTEITSIELRYEMVIHQPKCATPVTMISDHFKPRHQILRLFFQPKFRVQNQHPYADISGGRE